MGAFRVSGVPATGARVTTLGCRLNIAESERIAALVAGTSDLVVINSCAVTAEAVRNTRRAIRRVRREAPQARLLVTGCAAETERAALACMPEVDGLVPNAVKLDPRAWNLVEPSRRAPSTALRTRTRTRAFIPVQNGCDHSCTFCIIPQGRGPSRSLASAAVLRDIERRCEEGAREIVLTGVDLTSWGHDLPGAPGLGTLVEAILAAFPALPRLRLSSLDGIEIDQALFELFAGEERVMPHLHLSLQHGADLILKRMKRRHLGADALRLVARLKARRPQIAIGADLIAGFPTESPQHHAANLAIVRDLDIVHGHVFPFSPRPGTPAARMPQLGREIVKQRAAELRAQVAAAHEAWQRSLIGRPLAILAEADGTGHSAEFARVTLPAGARPGSLVTHVPATLENGLLR